MTEPDLAAAAAAVDAAQTVIDRTAKHLAASGGIDANQAVAYDLAHAASAVPLGYPHDFVRGLFPFLVDE